MNKKHVIVYTILAITAGLITADSLQSNPQCIPPMGTKDDLETHFLFFVDRTLEASVLTRIVYLMKAISCEIPTAAQIQLIAASAREFRGPATSKMFPKFLSSETIPMDEQTSHCQRFRSALGHAPQASLEKKNVQFIVPIFEEPGCSFQKVFQEVFHNDDRKENFYFNGILINAHLTPENRKSVRLEIPDLEKAIDPKRESLVGSANISDVHESAPLVQSYASMIRDIMLGKSVHDWEDETTTALPTTPATASASSESAAPKTTTAATAEDDLKELQAFNWGDEDDQEKGVEDNSTTTTATTTSQMTSTPSDAAMASPSGSEKRAPKNADANNTTSTTMTTTTTKASKFPTTSSDIEYDADIEEDADEQQEEGGDLALLAVNARGNVNAAAAAPSRPTVDPMGHVTMPSKWEHLEADTIVYVMLLFLLIWLFCLFICVVWMFYCTQNKKNKLESEADQNQPLLETGSVKKSEKETVTEKEKASEKASNKDSVSDEAEDEWKNIKPSKSAEPALKSETESAKQPPVAAHYDPVEVSEFEEKMDEDVDEERPRHGYQPSRKAAELQFD